MKTLLMLVLVAGCAKADPPVQPKPAESATKTKTTGADVVESKRDAGLVPPLTVPPEMGTVQTR